MPAALSESCTSLGEQRTSQSGHLQVIVLHGLQLPVFIVLEVCVLFTDLFPNGKPAVESMWILYLHFTFFLTDWSTNHLAIWET